uniref:Proline-rich P65 protein n=1 Tax=Cacopsylla melanoneura TaxID=428564 RepID=A0A8D8QU07_9HEMI
MLDNYNEVLRRDEMRCRRNDEVLRCVDQIEGRVAVVASKTERMRSLRAHYESLLERACPQVKSEDYRSTFSTQSLLSRSLSESFPSKPLAAFSVVKRRSQLPPPEAFERLATKSQKRNKRRDMYDPNRYTDLGSSESSENSIPNSTISSPRMKYDPYDIACDGVTHSSPSVVTTSVNLRQSSPIVTRTIYTTSPVKQNYSTKQSHARVMPNVKEIISKSDTNDLRTLLKLCKESEQLKRQSESDLTNVNPSNRLYNTPIYPLENRPSHQSDYHRSGYLLDKRISYPMEDRYATTEHWSRKPKYPVTHEDEFDINRRLLEMSAQRSPYRSRSSSMNRSTQVEEEEFVTPPTSPDNMRSRSLSRLPTTFDYPRSVPPVPPLLPRLSNYPTYSTNMPSTMPSMLSNYSNVPSTFTYSSSFPARTNMRSTTVEQDFIDDDTFGYIIQDEVQKPVPEIYARPLPRAASFRMSRPRYQVHQSPTKLLLRTPSIRLPSYKEYEYERTLRQVPHRYAPDPARVPSHTPYNPVYSSYNAHPRYYEEPTRGYRPPRLQPFNTWETEFDRFDAEYPVKKPYRDFIPRSRSVYSPRSSIDQTPYSPRSHSLYSSRYEPSSSRSEPRYQSRYEPPEISTPRRYSWMSKTDSRESLYSPKRYTRYQRDVKGFDADDIPSSRDKLDLPSRDTDHDKYQEKDHIEEASSNKSEKNEVTNDSSKKANEGKSPKNSLEHEKQDAQETKSTPEKKKTDDLRALINQHRGGENDQPKSISGENSNQSRDHKDTNSVCDDEKQMESKNIDKKVTFNEADNKEFPTTEDILKKYLGETGKTLDDLGKQFQENGKSENSGRKSRVSSRQSSLEIKSDHLDTPQRDIKASEQYPTEYSTEQYGVQDTHHDTSNAGYEQNMQYDTTPYTHDTNYTEIETAGQQPMYPSDSNDHYDYDQSQQYDPTQHQQYDTTQQEYDPTQHQPYDATQTLQYAADPTQQYHQPDQQYVQEQEYTPEKQYNQTDHYDTTAEYVQPNEPYDHDQTGQYNQKPYDDTDHFDTKLQYENQDQNKQQVEALADNLKDNHDTNKEQYADVSPEARVLEEGRTEALTESILSKTEIDADKTAKPEKETKPEKQDVPPVSEQKKTELSPTKGEANVKTNGKKEITPEKSKTALKDKQDSKTKLSDKQKLIKQKMLKSVKDAKTTKQKSEEVKAKEKATKGTKDVKLDQTKPEKEGKTELENGTKKNLKDISKRDSVDTDTKEKLQEELKVTETVDNLDKYATDNQDPNAQYDPTAAYDRSQYDPNQAYDPNHQYNPNEQYNQQYDSTQAYDPNIQYDPNQQYDPNTQYDPSQYPQAQEYDPNMPYDPNLQYDPNDPNMQYDPNQYPQDPNQQYAQDPNQYPQSQEYDPNIHYDPTDPAYAQYDPNQQGDIQYDPNGSYTQPDDAKPEAQPVQE